LHFFTRVRALQFAKGWMKVRCRSKIPVKLEGGKDAKRIQRVCHEG
jgi:hypothetical protein